MEIVLSDGNRGGSKCKGVGPSEQSRYYRTTRPKKNNKNARCQLDSTVNTTRI